jgi:hypothetical protein
MTDPDLSHIDPDAKKAELEQDAEHAKRQAQQEEQEFLQALENEEEFEHKTYEWIEIGDVELKVRGWMAGDVIDTVQSYVEAEQEGEIPNFAPMVEAAKTQTEVVQTADVRWNTDAKIARFWEMYYDEHGSNVLAVAFSRVFDPAIEDMEGKLPDSFQGRQGLDARHGANGRSR